MAYRWELHEKCKREIDKHCKKNPVIQQALMNKIAEIVENPYHYKPLRYDLAGERRVHILKNFVLKFEILESQQTIRFIFFGHHDEAYKR